VASADVCPERGFSESKIVHFVTYTYTLRGLVFAAMVGGPMDGAPKRFAVRNPGINAEGEVSPRCGHWTPALSARTIPQELGARRRRLPRRELFPPDEPRSGLACSIFTKHVQFGHGVAMLIPPFRRAACGVNSTIGFRPSRPMRADVALFKGNP
jgi:hypothetical protein